MKILHVLRSGPDRLPLDLARHQRDAHTVTVLLVQDAVSTPPPERPGAIYALKADLEARGLAVGQAAVDYDEAIRLMAEHDRVIVW